MTTTKTDPIIPQLIREYQERHRGTDAKIAARMDMPNNVFQMIKDGTMKLPITKVPALAQAISFPISDLLRVVMREYEPDLLKLVEAVWESTALTDNERRLLKIYRKVARGKDAHPVLVTGVAIVVAKDSVATA